MIVRIGPWIDPDSGEVQSQPAAEGAIARTIAARAAGRSRLARPLQVASTQRRAVPVAEEHTYRTAECSIDDALLDRLDELTRHVQEQAIAQAWSIDWATLATLRRQVADARAAGNRWVSLRKIGEIISLARARAARFFRKTSGATPFHH